MWSNFDDVCGLPSASGISAGDVKDAHHAVASARLTSATRSGPTSYAEEISTRAAIELQASDSGGVVVLPQDFPRYYPSESLNVRNDLVRMRSDDYQPFAISCSKGAKREGEDRSEISSTSMSSGTTNGRSEKSDAHSWARRSVSRKSVLAAAALSFALILAIAVSAGVRASGRKGKESDDPQILDVYMGDSGDFDNVFVKESSSRSPTTPAPTTTLYTRPIEGFATVAGHGIDTTTGGEGGQVVTVRDAKSFERYIKRDEPMIVQVDGMVDLSQNFAATGKSTYRVSADTTIIGLGANSGIRGGGIKVQGYKICNGNDPDEMIGVNCMEKNSAEMPTGESPENNIILRNLRIEDCPDDCIQITQFAHHVWIDHNSLSRPGDGLLDITRGSDLVTVSWNRFSDAHKTMLLGHNDDNGHQDSGRLRVTYHHNYFFKSESRNPRARFGEPVHIYNNLYLSNGRYALASQTNAGMVVEGNFFDNVDVPITTDQSDEAGRVVERFNQYRNSDTRWQTGDLAEPDTYYEFSLFNSQLGLGGPSAEDFGGGNVIEPFEFYRYRLDDPMILPQTIPQYAGTGRIARI